MGTKISRRAFILSALASVTTIAGIGGWWVFKTSQDNNIDLIVAILRKNLHYLKLDEAGLIAFAQDFLANQPNFVNSRNMDLLDLARPFYIYSDLFEITPASDELHRVEERMVTQFLMSTDFFWNGANESRPIMYLGYYTPYKQVCGNPFATLS